MDAMRLAMLMMALALVGICVWAVVRLFLCIVTAVFRGLRGACRGLAGCSESAPPRLTVWHVSHTPPARRQNRSQARGGPRMCADPRCRWLNPSHARFCAQCGQPLEPAGGRKAG